MKKVLIAVVCTLICICTTISVNAKKNDIYMYHYSLNKKDTKYIIFKNNKLIVKGLEIKSVARIRKSGKTYKHEKTLSFNKMKRRVFKFNKRTKFGGWNSWDFDGIPYLSEKEFTYESKKKFKKSLKENRYSDLGLVVMVRNGKTYKVVITQS